METFPSDVNLLTGIARIYEGIQDLEPSVAHYKLVLQQVVEEKEEKKIERRQNDRQRKKHHFVPPTLELRKMDRGEIEGISEQTFLSHVGKVGFHLLLSEF